jgi:phosphoglycerate dehydrogenase-like enzyme
VVITNAPGINAVSVAEHTIGLMIAASKYFVSYDRGLKEGKWPRGQLPRGVELDGKVLGQVGFGKIGSLVARKCRAAFNMEVLVYDPYVSESTIKEAVSGRKVDLDTLLENSDVVSLNLPSNEETRGLFDYKKFRKMKKTAILVNTARGDVVVESDLIRALNQGELFTAGLDVTFDEPPGPDNPLYDIPGITLTGHSASATNEVFKRVARIVLSDQSKVLQGKTPTYIV